METACHVRHTVGEIITEWLARK